MANEETQLVGLRFGIDKAAQDLKQLGIMVEATAKDAAARFTNGLSGGLNKSKETWQSWLNDFASRWKQTFSSGSIVGGIDNLTTGLKGAQTNVLSLSGALATMKNLLLGPAGIAIAVGAATFGFFEFSKSMLAVYEASDRVEKRLTVLTGSAAQAATIMKEVNKIALVSPFSLESLQQAAAQLKLFGLSVSDTLPIVQNFAAATGKDLATATETVGRLLQGNARAVMELRREGIITVPVLQQMGIDVALWGRASALTTAQVAALSGYLQNRFGTGAQAQLQTYTGAMQAIKNEFTEIAERVGQSVAPAFEGFAADLKQIADWLSANKETIALWSATFINSLETIAHVLDILIIRPLEKLGSLLTWIGEKLGQLKPSEDILGPRAQHDLKIAGLGPTEENEAAVAAAASKQAAAQDEAEKKLTEIHQQGLDKRLSDDKSYIDQVDVDAKTQLKFVADYRATLDAKHQDELTQIAIEIDALRKKGADESTLMQIQQAEQQKADQEQIDAIHEIDKIMQKQVEERAKKELELAEDTARKRLEIAKKNAELAEKTIIEGLKKTLTEEEALHKKIADAMKEQTSELEKQKQLKDAALEKYKEGPLQSLGDLSKQSAGTGGFGGLFERTFAPTAPTGPTLDDALKTLADREAAKPQQLKDIEAAEAASKGKITAEEKKAQNISNVSVTIDNTAIKASPELSKLVNDIVTALVKASGQAPNFQPTAAGQF